GRCESQNPKHEIRNPKRRSLWTSGFGLRISCWGRDLLGSFRGGLALLLAVGPVVLLLEFLDAAGRVDELHLAGEERVTRRADFDGDVLLGASCDELVAATARDGRLDVFGVNAGLHEFLRWLKRYFIVERRSGARQGQHPSGAEATMDFLKSWDLGASYGMRSLHREWLTPVMAFITHLGDDLTLKIVV